MRARLLPFLLAAAVFSSATPARSSRNNGEIVVRACPPSGPPGIVDVEGWAKFLVVHRFESDASAHGTVAQQTSVSACHEPHENKKMLHLFYDSVASDPKSPFGNGTCNDKLYEHDAVEAFLAVKGPGSSGAPHKYLETELAPTSALFVSRITNPDLTCAGITGALQNCTAAGVVPQARVDRAARRWYGLLSIPLKTIALASGLARPSAVTTTLTGNFFRIDTPLGGEKEWTCWRSTESVPACFHKPRYFGTITLE